MVHAGRHGVEQGLGFLQATTFEPPRGDGRTELSVFGMGQHGPVKPLLSSRERANGLLEVCFQHDGGPATRAEGDGVRGGLERLLFTARQACQAAGFERPPFPVLPIEVEAGFSR